MKWFRFYSEAMRNPKVMRLSNETHRFWVNLLCLANEGSPRGSLPTAEDIATVLHLNQKKVSKMVNDLVATNLIDICPETGALIPHNWEQRQKVSDDVSRRVRKHRDHAEGPDVTLQKRFSNVTETLQKQNCNGSRPREAEAEQEQEQEGDESGGERRRAGPAAAAPSGSLDDCIGAALEHHGRQAADAVAAKAADIEANLSGRFDCYAAALREVRRRLDRPGARPVKNLHTYTLSIAREWATTGIPPPPIEARASPGESADEKARKRELMTQRLREAEMAHDR